ncbi:MAG: hypothetical protein IJX43_01110 [Alphaproteobacteria bacterium]|nr:hypothetical protein [Alphaproteobacteria bacterium]
MKIKWKKIFDWSIKDVSPVLPVKDAWGHVKGYKVIVSYVHHGDDVHYFDLNQESYYTLYQGPEDAANTVRSDYVQKWARQQKRAAMQRLQSEQHKQH